MSRALADRGSEPPAFRRDRRPREVVRGSSAAASELMQMCWRRPAAIVQAIDVPRVLRAAEHAQVEVDFKVGAGEMIPEGATYAVISGQAGPELERGGPEVVDGRRRADVPTWSDYLAVALDEIIALPTPTSSVARRILLPARVGLPAIRRIARRLRAAERRLRTLR